MTADPTGARHRDFEDLFQREYERCVRAAQRIVGHPELSRDLAAEAFARAWECWPSLYRQRPGAWVVKVAINLAIDATRRRATPLPSLLISPAADEASVVRLTLTDAVRRLPSRQRDVIMLRYFADFSEDRIAAALGITNGSVKVHGSRGLTRLRTLLGASSMEEFERCRQRIAARDR